MSKLEINAGICGFMTNVQAEAQSKYQCKINIESQCKHVQNLAEKLAEVNAMDELYKKGKSQILAAAQETLPHLTCPAPIGILRAVEVCTGLALPKDVTIKFND